VIFSSRNTGYAVTMNQEAATTNHCRTAIVIVLSLHSLKHLFLEAALTLDLLTRLVGGALAVKC